MQPEILTYHADGLDMRGELYRPAGSERRSGVLVFPEAFGISDHARERAQRLAAEGHVALACDLHGNGTMIDDLGQAVSAIGALKENPARTRQRAQAALDALLATGHADPARIAAIGFCFGGTMALELARSGATLAAAVGFHSGLDTVKPAAKGTVKAKMLVCIGADDPMIDAQARSAFEGEMTAAGCDWQLHVYGNTVHSFTNKEAARRNMPDAIRYSPEADKRSWASMREMFGETLG